MNPTPVTGYECPVCYGLYDSFFKAEECCPPEIEELNCYQCAECTELHKTEDAANQCCYEGDEPLRATPAQLEAAGQQRLAL